MSSAGSHFGSPEEPRRQFQELSEITDEELRVRAADLACDQSVGLTAGKSAWPRTRVATWQDINAPKITEALRLRTLYERALISL